MNPFVSHTYLPSDEIPQSPPESRSSIQSPSLFRPFDPFRYMNSPPTSTPTSAEVDYIQYEALIREGLHHIFRRMNHRLRGSRLKSAPTPTRRDVSVDLDFCRNMERNIIRSHLLLHSCDRCSLSSCSAFFRAHRWEVTLTVCHEAFAFP